MAPDMLAVFPVLAAALVGLAIVLLVTAPWLTSDVVSRETYGDPVADPDWAYRKAAAAGRAIVAADMLAVRLALNVGAR